MRGNGIHAVAAPPPAPAARAFTLVELLIVIGVIAILAAMSFPIMGAIKRSEILHRAQAELGQVETAIESYKTKLGYYPPDNVPPQAAWSTTANWPVNQLYYELLGTTATNISGATITKRSMAAPLSLPPRSQTRSAPMSPAL